MEPLQYISNNIKPLKYSDFDFQPEASSALSFWKVYGKCVRKSDNKVFSTVIIPDKRYMESCLEFVDIICNFEFKCFVPCLGYINELDESKEMTWYHQILIFEEFKSTLAQYTNESDLNRMEFEALISVLIESTRFFVKTLGGIFPRYTPDCIVVQKNKANATRFLVLDMILIKAVPSSLPFEDTKWLAPEIYELYPSIISMTTSVKKNQLSETEDYSKAFLFSMGLVLLYTNPSKVNFQEKRKNAKSVDDLPKIWTQEASILELGMNKIRLRYSYTKEDYSMQILRGVIDHNIYTRIDLETIRAFSINGPVAVHLGDVDLSYDDMNFHPKLDISQPQKPASNIALNQVKFEESVVPGMRKLETSDDPYLFRADGFVEIEKKPLLSIFQEKSSQKTYSCLRHPISEIIQPKSDPYVKQLLSLEKIDCPGMMKFAGYFYEEEMKKDTLIIFFEQHNQTLYEYLTTKSLDRENLASMVKSLVEALYTLQSIKALAPHFLTPQHIFIIQNRAGPQQFKFKFLLPSEVSLTDEYRIWVSPELFLGENIKDRPHSFIYSFALVLLYSVLKTFPTSYRSELQDKSLFKTKEIDSIKTALVDFRKKLQIEVNNPTADTFEAKLHALIAQSLEINPFHRTDIVSWNLEQQYFNLKTNNLKKESGPIIKNQPKKDDENKPVPEVPKPKAKRSFFCCGSSKPKKNIDKQKEETRV